MFFMLILCFRMCGVILEFLCGCNTEMFSRVTFPNRSVCDPKKKKKALFLRRHTTEQRHSWMALWWDKLIHQSVSLALSGLLLSVQCWMISEVCSSLAKFPSTYFFYPHFGISHKKMLDGNNKVHVKSKNMH